MRGQPQALVRRLQSGLALGSPGETRGDDRLLLLVDRLAIHPTVFAPYWERNEEEAT
jgi:hypothetical protein